MTSQNIPPLGTRRMWVALMYRWARRRALLMLPRVANWPRWLTSAPMKASTMQFPLPRCSIPLTRVRHGRSKLIQDLTRTLPRARWLFRQKVHTPFGFRWKERPMSIAITTVQLGKWSRESIILPTWWVTLKMMTCSTLTPRLTASSTRRATSQKA